MFFLQLIVYSFVHNFKCFSSSLVNDKLDNFKFGQNDRKAKPVHIPANIFRSSADHSLPGKAIEKWYLFHILPFLVGNLILADDTKWRAYLMCHDIADVLFAVPITDEDTAYLKLLIDDFIELFLGLFPGRIPDNGCSPWNQARPGTIVD